jgi:hypothetical protein
MYCLHLNSDQRVVAASIVVESGLSKYLDCLQNIAFNASRREREIKLVASGSKKSPRRPQRAHEFCLRTFTPCHFSFGRESELHEPMIEGQPDKPFSSIDQYLLPTFSHTRSKLTSSKRVENTSTPFGYNET